MLLDIIFLIAGFVVLIYGANMLVDGGSALAHRLNISNMVIGLTVVAFGTSTPELVVNSVSSATGSSALALGNILGSNIFNILGILGITAMLIPLRVTRTTTWIEVPLAVFAAILVLLMLDETPLGVISRAEGISLLCFFAIFLIYTFVLAKHGDAGNGEEVTIKPYTTRKSIFFIFLGLAGLIIGGRLLVTGAVSIAQSIGITERIIGLTIVSIGTSLPELATSVIAARKGNADIAIGNVVGSNIFNTFLVLGVSATIRPIEAPAGSMTDLIVNIIAAGLLFLFIFTGKGRKISRWEGALFTMGYVIYLSMLIGGFSLI